MTNKSISLLMGMQGENYSEKKLIIKQIIEIEYKKIIAQTKNFLKMCDNNTLAKEILNSKNSEELFDYLESLNVVEISLLSSYGIDVAFMNLLKVSE